MNNLFSYSNNAAIAQNILKTFFLELLWVSFKLQEEISHINLIDTLLFHCIFCSSKNSKELVYLFWRFLCLHSGYQPNVFSRDQWSPFFPKNLFNAMIK